MFVGVIFCEFWVMYWVLCLFDVLCVVVNVGCYVVDYVFNFLIKLLVCEEMLFVFI